MTVQFQQFLSKGNFTLAFMRLKTASRNLYKTIYFEDLKIFELYLDENIDLVINNIRQDIYEPQKSHKFYIPKKDNLVRTLTMLSFVDLLVYQALLNVIADYSHDIISPYYNKYLFANYVNKSTASGNNKNFFYQSWKRRWKKYNEISKKHFDEGYVYLSEFDIASFFDTIDHNILCDILKNDHNIEDDILSILSKCLEIWTEDSNHKCFKSKHGIPQGPLSSVYLGELYLFYLDKEILKKTNKFDYKYLRYVDDIRIFSKDEKTCLKLIAGLDLLSKDLGLIPQSSKISTKKVSDISKEIKLLNSKFSEITKEYKENNEGKPENTLKNKTHKKLKKKFLNCFKQNSDEIYLDKTVIGFSLYKLNKDEEVKKCLLENYNLILTNIEGVFFYLKQHFKNDNDVNSLILSILKDNDLLFNHLATLSFKFFPELDFDEDIYDNYVNKEKYWLTQYYLLIWLKENNKNDLIMSIQDENNHFVNRKLNYLKYISSTDTSFRKIFIKKLLENEDELIALQGLYLLSYTDEYKFKIDNNEKHNIFIQNISRKLIPNIISFTLKNKWQILTADVFFNEKIWSDSDEYEELRTSFLYFFKTIKSDPSKSILNLNIFNNLLFNKLCNILSLPLKSPEYGVNLASNLIDSEFPICNKYWIEINEKRNQNTEAHPHDKSGNIRKRINEKESNDLFYKEKRTMEELCSYKKFPI